MKWVIFVGLVAFASAMQAKYSDMKGPGKASGGNYGAEKAPAPAPATAPVEAAADPAVPAMPAPQPHPVIEVGPEGINPDLKKPPIAKPAAAPAPEVEAPVEPAATPNVEAAPEVEAPVEPAPAPKAEAAPAGKDNHESCCGWAAFEECKNNADFMLFECAKSCHVKDGQADHAAVLTYVQATCNQYHLMFKAGKKLGPKGGAAEAKPDVKAIAPVEEIAKPELKTEEQLTLPAPAEPEVNAVAPVPVVPEPELKKEEPLQAPEPVAPAAPAAPAEPAPAAAAPVAADVAAAAGGYRRRRIVKKIVKNL